MAVLFGAYTPGTFREFSGDLHDLYTLLKWPGCEVYTFRLGSFSGGLILNPVFGSELSEFLYTNDSENSLVLVSGYFYNRQELTCMLGHGKDEFSSPELAFRLYSRFGRDFVNKINGDFIIIIYQPGLKSLLVFRDHLGIRPLSYTIKDRTFWFSSDGLILCKALYGHQKINPDFLMRYLKNPDEIDVNMLPAPEARKLTPGHYLELPEDMIPKVVKYWYPEKKRENSALDMGTAKSEMEWLLRDAVSIRSGRKFNAGTHLSGGLDSGTVAALARRKYIHQTGFHGFSWSPAASEASYNGSDERQLVCDTGLKCGVDPVFLELKLQDYIHVFENWRFIGESVHEISVRENARKFHVNLIFSGWGGDEFISINDRGIPSDLLFKFKWGLFFTRFPISKPVSVSKFIIKDIILPALGIDYGAVRSNERQTCRYLKKNKPGFRLFFSPLYKWRSRRDVHLALLHFGHLAERAELWFNNGYPAGVEYRYPLLDKRIVEYMLGIPSTILYNKGFVRLLLREISKDILPPSVVWSESKNNPAMFAETKRNCLELFAQIIPELEEIRKCPDFSFVNFETLGKDILEFPNHKLEGEIPEYITFPLNLKRLYAFIKGYCGQ